MADPIVISATFRLRRDTAANWTAVNPVLKLGEPGLETDTRRVKYGDGATAWNALGYTVAALGNGDYGDITVGGGGATMTIDPGAVTLAKMANVATATVFYRKSGGAGAPEVQTLATLKTDLGLTGTNSGDQFTAVTSSRILGRATAGFGAAEELTAAQVKTILSLGNVDNTSDANKPVSTAQATADGLVMRQASRAGVVRNGLFGEWPSAAAVPTGWGDNGSATVPTRVAGEAGPYAMNHVGNAGGFASIYQDIGSTAVRTFLPSQKWRLYAEVKLIAGALTGAGIYFDVRDNTGASVAGGAFKIDFAVDVDTTGAAPGAGVVGNVYRFIKDITVPAVAGVFWGRLFASTHSTTHGSIAAANELTWYAAGCEPRI